MIRRLCAVLILAAAACSPGDVQSPDEAASPQPSFNTVNGEPVIATVMVAGYTIVNNGWLVPSSYSIGFDVPCDTIWWVRPGPPIDSVYVGSMGCRTDVFTDTTYGVPNGGTVDVWSTHPDGTNKHLKHLGANYDRFVVHMTNEMQQVRVGAWANEGCEFKGWQNGINGPYVSTNTIYYHPASAGSIELWAYMKCPADSNGPGDGDDDGGDGCIICGDD